LPVKFTLLKILLCTLSFFLSCYASFAQHLLGKVVSVNIDNQELNTALNAISHAGNFEFSYKSNIILQHKKVSLKAQDKTVKQLLDIIFEGNFHYSEKGKYVILHSGGEKQFVISGYIQNGKTGERLSNVTVYEDQVLASTLTNEHGYFKLPIKNKKKLKTISIIARKESYTETYVDLNAGYDQELVLPILPSSEIMLEGVVIKSEEESSWANKIFLSSKQKIQNINIGSFIAKRPIQTSLLPGIGTHGLIGSQVVNKFSLNLLGGYTAGVNGFEFGSLFNINKGSVRYVQVAGIFNSVNGNVTGFQMGGIYNFISGNTDGYQVAGISNIVKGKVSGAQVAGISNINLDTARGIFVAGISNTGSSEVKGVQIAGIINKSKGLSKGVQLAGLTNWTDTHTKGLHLAGLNNHSRGSMKGMQMAGFMNYARKIKGFQFGVINIADTMDGFGLGLVNYYKNGHHKILVFANELQNCNVGYLSGAKNIYSLVTIGMNIGRDNTVYSASYGIGTEIRLSKKLALNPEIAGQTFYIGHWDYVPLAARAQLCVTYKIAKPFELFVAPVYTITETKSTSKADGYISWLRQPNVAYNRVSNSITGWVGWQAGIRIF
jgi:hypothetical protein